MSEGDLEQARAKARWLFGRRLSRLRDGYPQAYWAGCYGLSAGAVRDMEQGRVLPSRATLVLLEAIRMDRDLIRRAAKAAAEDLALVDQLRKVRN